jgi:hypothetical protein
MKKIILLILIAAVVYLNYANPKLADHQAKMLSSLSAAGEIPEGVQDKIWQDVDFSNFLILSVTKTTLDSKMITIGYLGKVRLINEAWAEDTSKRYLSSSTY